MANITFNSTMKVERKSKNEVPFDEETHKADLPFKDQILIALALGLKLNANVRVWENTKTKESGLVIADSTIDEICVKFGLV